MGTALAQTHTRDALGRITQTSEVLLGLNQPGKSYTYDTAGRLSSATINGQTTTWGYDANGNRTSENATPIATYDSEDRLQTWKDNTYQYNPAGDLSQKTTPAGTSKYSYDAQGNLRQVVLESGKVIDYAIDPLNRRTGKRIDGQLQWQLIWQSSLRPIARLKPDNTLDATYYYADKPNVPEAMTKDGKTYRIISDQNGSVRLVIDASTGEVAQQMDYDTWGQVINDTNPGFQPFGFAGGLYDPDTRLTRFGKRDNDAETGRWTAKDPILFNGGDSNLYGYVLQDPINWIDFYGFQATPNPNGIVPGGPWTPAPPGSGQLPDTFYGPKQPFGQRPMCQYVPENSVGGNYHPPYWKYTPGGQSGQPQQRFNINGEPITPEQAHPGNPQSPQENAKPPIIEIIPPSLLRLPFPIMICPECFFPSYGQGYGQMA
jgi:RHS repeat-associated protein